MTYTEICFLYLTAICLHYCLFPHLFLLLIWSWHYKTSLDVGIRITRKSDGMEREHCFWSISSVNSSLFFRWAHLPLSFKSRSSSSLKGDFEPLMWGNKRLTLFCREPFMSLKLTRCRKWEMERRQKGRDGAKRKTQMKETSLPGLSFAKFIWLVRSLGEKVFELVHRIWQFMWKCQKFGDVFLFLDFVPVLICLLVCFCTKPLNLLLFMMKTENSRKFYNFIFLCRTAIFHLHITVCL